SPEIFLDEGAVFLAGGRGVAGGKAVALFVAGAGGVFEVFQGGDDGGVVADDLAHGGFRFAEVAQGVDEAVDVAALARSEWHRGAQFLEAAGVVEEAAAQVAGIAPVAPRTAVASPGAAAPGGGAPGRPAAARGAARGARFPRGTARGL